MLGSKNEKISIPKSVLRVKYLERFEWSGLVGLTSISFALFVVFAIQEWGCTGDLCFLKMATMALLTGMLLIPTLTNGTMSAYCVC